MLFMPCLAEQYCCLEVQVGDYRNNGQYVTQTAVPVRLRSRCGVTLLPCAAQSMNTDGSSQPRCSI